MDTSFYSTLSGNFYHYAKRIFSEIYPLSRNEFELDSIHRRAADDYLVQIIERSREMVCVTMIDYRLGTAWQTYNMDFKEGIRTKVLPQELGNRLLILSELRNDVVHENEKVKKKQLFYGKLGIIVTVAYSMHELAKSFNEVLHNTIETYDNILVNRNYLLERLKMKEDNNRNSEYVVRECNKVRFRLNSDQSIPDIIINKSIIKGICRGT
jgi:hypothetical protein